MFMENACQDKTIFRISIFLLQREGTNGDTIDVLGIVELGKEDYYMDDVRKKDSLTLKIANDLTNVRKSVDIMNLLAPNLFLLTP